MEEVKTPQARHWAIPLIFAVVLYVWSSTYAEPTTLSMVVLAASFVMGIWCVANFFIHLGTVVHWLRLETRELEFKFTQNYKLEVMARMTEFQVKAVRAGRFMTDILPTDSGPVDMIRGTNVNCYTGWYILVRSTERSVYPINNFMKDTYHMDVLGDHATDDYTQAREFHAWLYEMGIAEWGRGNTSMSWVSGWNAKKVMDGFGWDEGTYAE